MSPERVEQKKWTKEGVIFLIEQDGLFLLEERPLSDSKYPGYTIIPGGKMEKGESQYQALFREMDEELKITGRYTIEKLDEFEHAALDGTHLFSHAFIIRLQGGRVINSQPEKGEHIWLSMDEAKKRCAVGDSKYVLTLAEAKLNEAIQDKG
jgi:8-oxo-dGTP pyrophosphatase MutT (NUDIX family)